MLVYEMDRLLLGRYLHTAGAHRPPAQVRKSHHIPTSGLTLNRRERTESTEDDVVTIDQSGERMGA